MPKTAVFNVRMDIRAIATLFKHYQSKGVQFSSVSSMTRRAIEMLAEELTNQLGAEPFTNTAEAVNYLESLNLMKPLRTRGNKSIIKKMQEDSLNLDGFSTSYMKKKGHTNVDPDQFEAARRVLEDKEDSNAGAILGPLKGEIKDDT